MHLTDRLNACLAGSLTDWQVDMSDNAISLYLKFECTYTHGEIDAYVPRIIYIHLYVHKLLPEAYLCRLAYTEVFI